MSTVSLMFSIISSIGLYTIGDSSIVDSITEEEYIARMDLTSLQQATTGLYNDLWNGNYGFNCRLQRINVCADDITYRAAKANNELANYYRLTPNITANNADYKTTWELFFTVINNANKLINKAVLPEDATLAKQYEEVLGEAYFLRGLSYFYLVRKTCLSMYAIR